MAERNYYRDKFHAFQKECQISKNDLQEICSDSWHSRNWARNIWNKLPEGQARKNLETILTQHPNTITEFLANLGNDRDVYGELSMFLMRLAQNAVDDTDGKLLNARVILHNIISDLLDLLGDLRQSEERVRKIDPAEWLQILVDNYQLQLQDARTLAPDETVPGLFQGIKEYLGRHQYDDFRSSDDAQDDWSAAFNVMKKRICGPSLDELCVIEILKPSAPDSLWEIACLQAGISKACWVKK